MVTLIKDETLFRITKCRVAVAVFQFIVPENKAIGAIEIDNTVVKELEGVVFNKDVAVIS